MALLTVKGREIPEGAVAVTKDEALKYQTQLIHNWPSKIDVFSLIYPKEIVGAVTLTTGFTVINHFSRFYGLPKLYTFLTFTTYALPAIVSTSLTDTVVTNKTLLMNIKCPLCNQLLFGGIQFYAGIIFPAVYGNFTLTVLASATGKFPFRSLASEPKKFWAEQFKVVKAGVNVYKIAGILQTVLILGIPYLQAKQFSRVMEQVRKEEESEFLEE